MDNFGFVKVAAASPRMKVADCGYNSAQILDIVNAAQKQGVSVVVFPELCLTGYTCNDLFLQRALLDGALDALRWLCEKLSEIDTTVIIGLPLEIRNKLYNTAAVIDKGEIAGFVPKIYLPNYNEFYDKRWFSSGSEIIEGTTYTFGNKNIPVSPYLLFNKSGIRFASEICEDLWTAIPPSSHHCLAGADIVFNLSASNETTGKHNYRKNLISQQSARCISGYVYSSAGIGESSTDLVFSGSTLIAENGSILVEGKRFQQDNQLTISDIDIEQLRSDRLRNKSFVDLGSSNTSICYQEVQLKSTYSHKIQLNRNINPTPFVPFGNSLDERCDEIFSIQTAGLMKRLEHTMIRHAVIGISGGLDSTLALLVAVKAFDLLSIPRENIVGITMPGFGTTDRTYNNAHLLMKSLNITIEEISIKNAVLQHFKDIGQDQDLHDITYENSQARERTQILMDYANKVNGLVIGTGDMSELALGWCTYNGDHMSMYAVNTGVPKTLVRTLVKWVSANHMTHDACSVLNDIIDTPISPELLPADNEGNIAQKTEDVVGPYLLHDFFLYYVLRYGFSPKKIFFLATQAFHNKYDKAVILKWLKTFFRRFFSQQFKRSCMPDGPKVGSVNLSPRGDWRMPSDASVAIWLKQLDEIEI